MIARLMLSVMLATFVSPSLSWGMIATHEQLSHGITDIGHEAQHGDHHHGHGHDYHQDDDSHQNPHSYIGHLFTHMPVGLFSISTLVIQPPTKSRITFLQHPLVTVDFAPPLRPPKPLLFL